MRKRTYTALVDNATCVSTGGSDVSMKHCSQGSTQRTVSNNTASHVTEQTDNTLMPFVSHNTTTRVTNLLSSQANTSSLFRESVETKLLTIDDTPMATIHNLVGTCCISSSVMPIDLEYVYRSMPNSFYCRTRFAAVTIRFTDPVCTGLLFTSGKLVVTGCKSLTECILASLKIVRMLERHIPTITFQVRSSVVQNVVAHVVIPMGPGAKLNIDRLYLDRACNCTCNYTTSKP
jgi:Transcription factor TFIID (or TATA-binding protein, TBP)